MIAFFARRWFLLVLIGGIAVALVRPDWLAWTVHLQPNWIIGPALFLMSWSLPTDKVVRALRYPWPALWAALISYSVVPLAAVLLGVFAPLVDFRIGLIIVAAAPCSLASAVIWTRMAGGNEATALLVITLTSMTSWLATTAWLTAITGQQTSIDPLRMMLDLLLNMVLPISLGQLVRRSSRMASFAITYKTPLGIVAQSLILLIIYKAAVNIAFELRSNSSSLSAWALASSVILPVAVHLTGLTCGLWSSRLLGFSREDQVGVAIAGSQKTLPVALLLFSDYYQTDFALAVLPLAFYHFGQLIVDTFIAENLAKKDRKKHSTLTESDKHNG